MASSLVASLANRSAQRAPRTKEREVRDVIKRLKEVIAVYGITAEDLGLLAGDDPAGAMAAIRKRPPAVKPPAAKSNEDTRQNWAWRCPQPGWLRC